MATGVQISGKIKPLATAAPVYPVFEDTDGQGGWRSVSDVTARDGIPASFRKIGMVVVVLSTGVAYQLQGGITNADWHVYGAAALSNVLYADQGAAVNGNGAIGSPFNTLTAAVAAGNALGKPSVTIYMTEYDYSGEATLVTGDGIKFYFIGMGDGTNQNSTRIPDVEAGGDCLFQNLFLGSLAGLSITQDGVTEVYFNSASCLGVAGKPGQQMVLYVNGFSTTFDPNNFNSTINGAITNAYYCLLNGATCVAPNETCSVLQMSLRNGAVLSCGTLECVSVGAMGGSYLNCFDAITGTGAGKITIEDSHISSQTTGVSGFQNTSTFRGAIFDNPTKLDFTATSCMMDVDSYYSLFASGGNTTGEIMSLTAGEPSCRVPRGDNDNFVAMSGQGKIVIPAGVLTANHNCQLSSSDSVNKQLIIFDSFAHEGFTFGIRDGITGTTLYTFGNSATNPSIWRATIVVLDHAGNSFGLFSVEPIIWNTP